MPVYLPKITINSNGSVTPEIGYISRSGNVYTLTDDVIDEYSIDILCSNIVFDGAGHMINISKGDNSGLRLSSVTNVTVKNLELGSQHNTMILDYCSNCVFTAIKSGDKFIAFTYSKFNTITESNIKIGLLFSEKNVVLRNNITGLSVFLSFNNNFSQNNIQCSYVPNPSFNSTDYWNNGSVGNYWSDYLIKYPNASEIGDTGIGNTPYVIDADNVDNFPLMYPWGAPEIALLGMQNATYSGSCLLNFTVSKPAVWMGYSLDGQENVTITGNSTISGLTNGLHNITVYAKDTFGNEGASETINFTVALESFPTAPVLAAAATLAIACIAILVYFKKRRATNLKRNLSPK